MIKRAKTKKNFIKVLCVILGVVFALSMGYTFAAEILNFEFGSNSYSTTTYATNQQYTIINDTINNPIPFGTGAHNYEVAIEYSFGYDFDIRIKYSLEWNGGNNTDINNVILNYANRDAYIVDNEYIYYKDTISAGNGTLMLFTGVDFIDSSDESYIGASLTINIDEVRIYKEGDTYDETHSLYVDSEAGRAWLKYKNSSTIEGAYVLIYNKRSEENYYISHPGLESAYYKTVSASNVVENYRWAGGNKYYAGLSAYIITGDSPITISTSIVGTWRHISTPSQAVSENNIKYNYSSDWIFDSYQTNGVFENRHYAYVIPANSAVYVEFLESIEITCRTPSNMDNFQDYAISTAFALNGNQYTDANFVNGICETTISSAGTFADTMTYSQPNLDVINTSTYQPGLYDVTLGVVGGSQTFNTNISLTNNTSSKIRVNSVSFQLKYTLSNAQHHTEESDEFNNPENQWSRKENLMTISLSADNINNYIAPYTTVNIKSSFSASLAENIINTYLGRYDAWVELVVSSIDYTAVADTVTTTNLSVETSAEQTDSGTIITYNVKNKSNEVISNISATLGLAQLTPSYDLQTTQPSDWLSSFWKYYYLNNGEYEQVQSNVWSSSYQYYSLSYISNNITISSPTIYNGFVQSGTTYTSTTLSLLPNESAKILSFNISNTDNELVFTASASGQSVRTNTSIDIVNEGTEFAYIVNNSTNSYYVRFTGSVDTSVPNIETIDDYNYYIGIVRPGQIVKLNMSGNSIVQFETIQATDTFTSTTLESWGTQVQTIFENYFK